MKSSVKNFYLIYLIFLSIGVHAQTPAKWIKIQTSNGTVMGLKSDSTLWAWGNNISGIIGDSTFNNSLYPKLVSKDKKWKDFELSSSTSNGAFCIALCADSTIWTWGNGYYNTLGNENIFWNVVNFNRPYPKILNNEKWIAFNGTSAIKKDNTVWVWGINVYKDSFGSGNTKQIIYPEKFRNSADWKFIVDQITTGFGIKNDGSLWTWQYKMYGNYPYSYSTKIVEYQVGRDKNWTYNKNWGLMKTDSTYWAWEGDSIPTQILPSNFKMKLITKYKSKTNVGIKTDGTLWAWGQNIDGFINKTIKVDSIFSSPVQIGLENDWNYFSNGFYYNSSPYYTTIAAKGNGYCVLGDNQYGQFGDFTTIDQNTFSCLNVTNSIDEEIVNDQIKVYPNPNEGKFTLEFNQVNVELKIFNIFSELIYSTEILDTKNEFDLSHYPNGIYLISLKSDKGTSYSKIVISK
ncbi:MAG: hypothetical protein RLZZ175_594 [Bacteroidota bacterium]|jgi:hypothetical protein